jgi:acyl phosphate:glycerol-3-phosphate acyltransferase
MTPTSILVLIGAYLIGAIPTAVWLSKGIYGADIRQFGSGNAGSTNMYRTFGFKAGLITQLIDVLKGWVAAMLPTWAMPEMEHLMYWKLAAGLLAVLGHSYPIWAGFKGGKGVNTILGMFLGIHWLGAVTGLAIFILSLHIFRMVSVGSMLGVSSFPIVLAIQYALSKSSEQRNALLPLGVIGLGLTIWVVFTHRANIERIRAGTESKVDLIARLRAKLNKG